MNQTIETILAHRSIRKFKDQPLTKKQIELIVKSAQAAATSSFVQAYSIIGVNDPKKKSRLARIAGDQSYVEKNGHFFVFCADLYRLQVATDMEDTDHAKTIETTEKFMVALVDAALAAQNAVTAAESMGLGICYIGGLRNDAARVSDLLQLPERVIPLFGCCMGVPDHEPGKKPRLPMTHIYHEETYEQNKDIYQKELRTYNDIVSKYYNKRTNGKRSEGWTKQIAKLLARPSRTYMKEFLKTKKLPLK